MMSGGKHIYFIKPVNLSGPVKIGTSKEPDGRVKVVSLWSPMQLELVVTVPGGFAEETYLHREFRQHRMHGEWFMWTPALQRVMDHAIEHGELPMPEHEVTNISMAEEYAAGFTLKEIGDSRGISRERVRQILRAEGVPSLGLRDQHRKWSVAEVNAERVLAMASAGATLKEIAEEIGDTQANVRVTLKRRNVTLPRSNGMRQETKVKAQLVAADYLAGLSGKQIAERHGIHKPHIYRFLKIAGVAPLRNYHSEKALI